MCQLLQHGSRGALLGGGLMLVHSPGPHTQGPTLFLQEDGPSLSTLVPANVILLSWPTQTATIFAVWRAYFLRPDPRQDHQRSSFQVTVYNSHRQALAWRDWPSGCRASREKTGISFSASGAKRWYPDASGLRLGVAVPALGFKGEPAILDLAASGDW